MSEVDLIEQLLARYATAIDTRDWALLRTCFTDDVAADYGDIGGWTTAEGITSFMEDAHAGFGATNHMLTNMAIDVESSGARATSRCYVHAVLTLLEDPGTWFDTVGQYDDVLVRTSDGWRIAQRTFRATRMTSGGA